MPKLKKLVVILLTFALSFSLIPTESDAAALSKTRLDLQVGKTAKLRMKNTSKKVKWASSNSSVASVSQYGNVKAKKKGTCKITAKVGTKRYLCHVKVKKKAAAKNNTYSVYVTDTGSKYHRAGCRYLWNSSHKISKSTAQSLGYDACSVCCP